MKASPMQELCVSVTKAADTPSRNGSRNRRSWRRTSMPIGQLTYQQASMYVSTNGGDTAIYVWCISSLTMMPSDSVNEIDYRAVYLDYMYQWSCFIYRDNRCWTISFYVDLYVIFVQFPIYCSCVVCPFEGGREAGVRLLYAMEYYICNYGNR